MSETQTTDLADWLTQIWDEEEAAMKRVGERIWFVCDDGHFEEPTRDDDPWDGTGEYVRWDDGDYRLPNHHNTWLEAFNPASVLARIAADRKILELHGVAWNGEVCTVCHHLVGRELQVDNDAWPCQTVRLLASPYKGREGWQEEWGDE
jgi:hypothetical protein